MATFSPAYGLAIPAPVAIGAAAEDSYQHVQSELPLANSDGSLACLAFAIPGFGGGSGGWEVPGYTVRQGDTLLVIDATGKMVGILPS